ncbi:MAG: dephospho-CoA kinase [Dokdonella sp.]
MFTVALTGGIASGKSEVERRFAARGVEIIDADLVARDVIALGTPGLAEVIAAFGSDVLGADGGLDRRAMRERVFADPEARQNLESIIHPRVRTTLQERAAKVRSTYGMLVIPLFVESGEYHWVDRVLVVDVPRTVQIARLLARDQITQELAESMLDAQSSREQRLAIADDVIDNNADFALLDAKVEALHRNYVSLAGDKIIR